MNSVDSPNSFVDDMPPATFIRQGPRRGGRIRQGHDVSSRYKVSADVMTTIAADSRSSSISSAVNTTGGFCGCFTIRRWRAMSRWLLVAGPREEQPQCGDRGVPGRRLHAGLPLAQLIGAQVLRRCHVRRAAEEDGEVLQLEWCENAVLSTIRSRRTQQL